MEDGRRIKQKRKLPAPRRFIGQRMSESLRDYPQMSGSIYLATDEVFALKDRLKAQNKNVTMTSVFARLFAVTLAEYPVMNSALIDGHLHIYESVNIAIGVGLEQGIMTVVIKEAQDKNIWQISDELKEMTEKLASNTLPLSDMKGSTFTLSNMGAAGFESFTPVLNPPETAIIGIGASQKRLVVLSDNSTAIQMQTCFSLTSNHAVVDGYHGGQFILKFKEKLQDPQRYMAV